MGQGGKTRRAGETGEAFVVDDGSGLTKTAGPAAGLHAAGVDALDTILALQSVDDPLYAKRKAVKRGHSLLDALEELKADLLAGQINDAVLSRMTGLIQQGKAKNDPELDALIADIELRVRVELAKLGRFPGF